MAQVKGVRSVGRAIAVVRAVSTFGSRGCRLVDLVEATGLSKTTLHRLLGTMVAEGWLDLDPDGNMFHIGLPLAGIGIVAAEQHGLTKIAAPHLVHLADLTGDTVYLSIRVGNGVVCVDKASGGFPIQAVTMDIGGSRILGSCAGSLAVLAGLDNREVADFLDSISTTVGEPMDSAVLAGLIIDTRRRGYALAPKVFEPDVGGIGVPVRAPDGVVIGAFSIEAVESRLGEPRRTHVVGWLKRESAALTETLQRLSPHLSPAAVRRIFLRP